MIIFLKNARNNEVVNQNVHKRQVSKANNKKKVLSAIRNSNADNEKSTSAIRNSLKKYETLYSG